MAYFPDLGHLTTLHSAARKPTLVYQWTHPKTFFFLFDTDN